MTYTPVSIITQDITQYVDVNAQPKNATLTSLSSLATTGMVTQTGNGNITSRSILGTSGRITVGNGNGVADNPTIDLTTSGVTAGSYKSVTVDVYGRVLSGSNPTTLSGYGITDAQDKKANLTSLGALASTGILVQTVAGSTITARSLEVGTGISLTNANGVSGNPTISVIDNTSTQKIQAKYNGTLVSTRKAINLATNDPDITIADDAANDCVNITMNTQNMNRTINLYIANNTATSFVPDFNGGLLFICCKYMNINYAGVFKYNTTSPAYLAALTFKAGGSNVNSYTTALTGTSGANGNLNVAAVSTTGRIYIENRTGSPIYIQYTIMGG